MKTQKVRVIVASEYPEVRHFLRAMVERERATVVEGEAPDVANALTLARNLKPDVAIIDCHLPHVVGLDTIPLSRTGGLDVSQTICREIPKTRVILLSHLSTDMVADRGSSLYMTTVSSVERTGAGTPLALHDLCLEIEQPDAPVFANLEVKPGAPLGRRLSRLTAMDVLFGGLGILGGLSLVLTLVLVEAWVILAFAGVTGIALSAGLFWKRTRRSKLRRESESLDTRLLSPSKEY